MVSDAVIASLIGVLGSLLIAFVVGVIGYLGKDKIKNIEDKIDNTNNKIESVEGKVEEISRKRQREHNIVLGWLDTLTEALKRDGYDVERPEEIERDITIDDDKKD